MFCLIFSLFFLVGTAILTALITAFRNIHKRGSQKQLKALGGRFFYRRFHLAIFPENEYETLFFATTCAQHITRFFFAAFSIGFLLSTSYFSPILYPVPNETVDSATLYLLFIACLAVIVLLSFILGDYFPRILGTRYAEATLRFCAPGSSIFLFISFPFTYILLHFTRMKSKTVYFDTVHSPEAESKQEIIEIIREAKLSEELDANEKKLISSVLSFTEHLTREVMIPRVEVFSLEACTTIKDAAILLEEEGYSRVPVYEDTVDNIVGILMYKDVLGKYMEYEQSGNDASILQAPISSIQKTPLYTPETKRISDLLQEFKKKQTHIAIVVDEYGGTEGIITIEDILEDIVGEIADEYDEEEELFVSQPDGSWIVDPRMSILDAEEQLGIFITQEGDFDTIGGYIFHCAGEIPKKGFKIQSDEFELEVVKSNERTIEKVKIRARPSP